MDEVNLIVDTMKSCVNDEGIIEFESTAKAIVLALERFNRGMRKDIETVVYDDRVIGYRVKSTHVYGFLQEAPSGWLIGRRKARTIEFYPELYNTRERANKALINKVEQYA